MSDAPDTTDAAVAAHWDANADRWTEEVRAGRDLYRDAFTWPAFRDFLGEVAGLRVIDLGCGEGTNTRRLARAGARMTGVDLSARLIAHAREAEAGEPLGIDYRSTSFAARTGLPEASFDAAVSTLALMDAPDLDGAMREAYRLLRPGGFLAFSILHPCFITPGLRWQKDADGRATGLVVARYFDRAPFTERWTFPDRPEGDAIEPFEVPRFPRTLSDYLNAVAAAGLRIAAVAEPLPDADAIARAPRFARWQDLAAFLLMVRADRPPA
jgi:SAM-dependent methyltransferase